MDLTPIHSHIKCLDKYPQQEFPYGKLVEENKKRTKEDGDFELIHTNIFDNNQYFDVFIEYVKKDIVNIFFRITNHNRSNKSAVLHLLPTLLFRIT